MWRVVATYMSQLSEDFKKIIMEYNKAKTGTVEEEPQWRQCLSSTAGAFGMPLGLLYINEKFSGGSKEKVVFLSSSYCQLRIKPTPFPGYSFRPNCSYLGCNE